MRGGKRIGAGRKNTGPKVKITVILDEDVHKKAKEKYGRKLSITINELLRTLLNI